MSMRTKMVPALLSLCAIGCGGSSGGTDMAAMPDLTMAASADLAMAGPSLLGTWKHQGMQSNATRTRTLVLSGMATAGDAVYTHIADYDAGGVLGNCLITRKYTGKFTATTTMITFTFASGTSKTEECDDETLDKAEMPTDAMANSDADKELTGMYTLTANELKLGTTFTFTRM